MHTYTQKAQADQGCVRRQTHSTLVQWTLIGLVDRLKHSLFSFFNIHSYMLYRDRQPIHALSSASFSLAYILPPAISFTELMPVHEFIERLLEQLLHQLIYKCSVILDTGISNVCYESTLTTRTVLSIWA